MGAANDRSRFRPSMLTTCIRAAKAAGANRFKITFDQHGMPVVEVFDDEGGEGEASALAALEAWDREQTGKAA